MCWGRAGGPATTTWRPGSKAAWPGSAGRISASRSTPATRRACHPDHGIRRAQSGEPHQAVREGCHASDARLARWRRAEPGGDGSGGADRRSRRSAWKTPRRSGRRIGTSSTPICTSWPRRSIPTPDRAYNLKSDYLKLSKWAQQYEREHGGIVCLRREGANELRDAIDNRDPQRRAGGADPAARHLHGGGPRAGARQADRRRARRGRSSATPCSIMPRWCAWPTEPGGPTTRYTTRTVLDVRGACAARRRCACPR